MCLGLMDTRSVGSIVTSITLEDKPTIEQSLNHPPPLALSKTDDSKNSGNGINRRVTRGDQAFDFTLHGWQRAACPRLAKNTFGQPMWKAGKVSTSTARAWQTGSSHRENLPQHPLQACGALDVVGYACWQTEITVLRSQRWAGSASTRGCHIADTLNRGRGTGSSKCSRPDIA